MNKLLLVSSFAVLSAVPLVATSQNYTDPAIQYVTQQQIMLPTATGDFDEQGTVSRLEFTLDVVDRFYGDISTEGCFDDLAPSTTARFTRLFRDVTIDEWYAQHLCAAMRAGLIQGNADGTFRPFASINSAEAATILARAYGFPRAMGTGMPWYAGSVESLQLRGAIARETAPEMPIRRSAMADMFYALRNSPVPVAPVSRRPQRNETETVAPLETPAVTLPVIIDTTPVTTEQQAGCPITRVNSPGTALLILGMEAHPRTLERGSHRVLEQKANAAYANGSSTGPNEGRPVTNLMERCAGTFATTPGGGLLRWGDSVPRTVIVRIPHRLVREEARQRGLVDDFRVNRNVGY